MTQAKELIAKMLFAFAAAISVAAVLVICIFISATAFPLLLKLVFQTSFLGLLGNHLAISMVSA